jgi:hypothetical protein
MNPLSDRFQSESKPAVVNTDEQEIVKVPLTCDTQQSADSKVDDRPTTQWKPLGRNRYSDDDEKDDRDDKSASSSAVNRFLAAFPLAVQNTPRLSLNDMFERQGNSSSVSGSVNRSVVVGRQSFAWQPAPLLLRRLHLPVNNNNNNDDDDDDDDELVRRAKKQRRS